MGGAEEPPARGFLVDRHCPEHLAAALRACGDRTLPLRERYRTTNHLIAYGRTAAAAESIARLEDLAPPGRGLEQTVTQFRAQNDALRALDVERRLPGLGRFGESLLAERRPLLHLPERPRGLLVVFATVYDNFELSLPVLHLFLERYGFATLYLKDPNGALFLKGLGPGTAGFRALVDRIRRIAGRHCLGDIRVMGYSSSGYAALLAGHMLDATALLGFSVASDLSPRAALGPGGALIGKLRAAGEPELLGDLRPFLAGRPSPRRILLHYGLRSAPDRAQAEHLRGLPNVEIFPVADSWHCVVRDLLPGRGFERALDRLLLEPPGDVRDEVREPLEPGELRHLEGHA